MLKFSQAELLLHIHGILAFEFSELFADLFLVSYSEMRIDFSKKTKKIKQLLLGDAIQAVYRPPFGTFSVSLDAIRRILPGLPFPHLRVQVLSDISEFIRQGKSVFSKHILLFDPNRHIGQEVFVVDEKDQLLAVGKLLIPPIYIPFTKVGSAVRIRKGSLEEE